MKYPLIILGAGASYDSLHLSELSVDDNNRLLPFRPPLTNDLFKRSLWNIHIQRWDEIKDLATDTVGGIGRYGGLEAYLTHLLNNVVPTNEKRAKQLLAVRFYLASLFKTISNQYYNHGNNFNNLLYTIEDECSNRAIIVNYNYDLLFERNIPSLEKAEAVDDFVSGNIKVFKIHGSCNWVHQPINQMAIHDPSSYVYFVVNAKHFLNKPIPLNSKVINRNWDFVSRLNQVEVNYYLPAIAIPLANKKNYVCPDSQIEIFKENLKYVDRILIIGWRGNDSYLIELLNNFSFPNKILLYIITEKITSANAVAQKFDQNKFDLYPCNVKGFSQFVRSKEYIAFWR